VPGAVQLDWAAANNWPPYWHGENPRAYDGLEDHFWTYETRLEFPSLNDGSRLFFVCGGVDYRFTIALNGQTILDQEGMFTPVEIELTGRARGGDGLRVVVHPAPKSVAEKTRAQADHSCKPAVSYGWDFHPRLIPLGIWQDAHLEVRPRSFLAEAQVDYRLSEDLKSVALQFTARIDGPSDGCDLRWTLLSPDGATVFSGTDQTPEIANPALWWPHDQGTPALYTWRAELLGEDGAVIDRRQGRIGIRRVRLVMAPDQWIEPIAFPKSRSHPPMTLEINGRPIFAKGANWVSPEIFPGLLNAETYNTQLHLVRHSNMNLLRLWGGAPAQKESFYELCDELGIMLWQEFPLACNCYPDDPAYLRVLDQESRSLIHRLKPHPSVVLWCGGNELFNAWSRMTDQALPLRLLASNCFQLDPQRPFLPTSPVDGVGHGYYAFRHHQTGEEAWSLFQNSSNTAYCEFGVPGPASGEVLREIIPEAELFPPRTGGAWKEHHAAGVWEPSCWLDLPIIEHYFGPATSLEAIVERGQLLQAEGYKGLYEEARRQKPVASMALCWCLNEPWPTAANNSLISWPSRPKPALAAVAAACRPVLASARIRKLQWTEGEWFDPEIWWLNDAPESCAPGEINAHLEAADGDRWPLLSWRAGALQSNQNLRGPRVQWQLPDLNGERFTLVLETPERPAAGSRYTLLFRRHSAKHATPAIMNLG
jgi:beta-mannosidase